MAESEIFYASIVIIIVAFIIMVFYLYKWYIDSTNNNYDGVELVNPNPILNNKVDKSVGTSDHLDEEYDLVEIDIDDQS